VVTRVRGCQHSFESEGDGVRRWVETEHPGAFKVDVSQIRESAVVRGASCVLHLVIVACCAVKR